MTNTWQQDEEEGTAQNREGGARNRVAPCDSEDDGSSCSSSCSSDSGIGGRDRNSSRTEHVGDRGAPSQQIGFCGTSSLSVTAAAAALSVADGRDGGTSSSSRTVKGAAAALAVTRGGHPELFRSARANSAANSGGSGAGSIRSGISGDKSYPGGLAATDVGDAI